MARNDGWTPQELDATQVALAVLDASGAITQINRACCDILKAPRPDLLGHNWFGLYLSEDQRSNVEHLFREAIEGANSLRPLLDQPGSTETADGRSIRWRIAMLHGEDGAVEGALCQGEDITAFRQVEQVLRYESEEQRALNTILRVSLEDLPLQQQFERVLDIILALSWLPVEPKGGIFQVEEQAETLLLKAQRGLATPIQTACARVPFGYCLCGRAAASQQIQYASCLDPRHDILYPGIAPHGHYNVPILSRRGLLGVMVLYLRHGHIQREREVEFLGAVANTLAGMIEHRLIRDALLASRSRLAEAQRIAQLGGWEWDIGQDRFRLSDEACAILGVTECKAAVGSLEEMLGFVRPAEREAVRRAFRQAADQGGALRLDFGLALASGETRIVQGQAEAQRNAEGWTTSLSGTLQDITQGKLAEERLRLSAAVFENTTEGVMITDRAGHIIAVNNAFTDITGYTQEELLGKTSAVLRSGRHDEAFYSAMWGEIQENGSWQGEIWNRRKNGDIYPEWLSISTVKDEQGRVSHYVGVFSDISAMKESESRLDHLAHHDPLTGLPNRLLLNARMEHSLARARRNHSQLAVLFIDLDRFKYINDTLGHPIGDLLLQGVAQRLTACVREEDTVTRLGGDEFTILLEELADSRHASTVAQNIIASLAERFMLQGHEVYVTCSIGISLFPNDGEDITTLFKNADSALYRAKEEGRNNYQYYVEELTTRAMERLAMENSLRHAVARNELVVYYQPQVDLYSGRIIGMEALLRWRHPDLGLVSPGAFIPLAEETGLIVPIGEWVLRTACAQLKQWIDEGLPKIRVGVNLSSRQFNLKNLAEIVAGILHDTGLDPACLELELTENLIMQDAEHTVVVLERLKALGVQFSIDDFGTGYSSLSYLKRFPIDRIKIDQSFVRNITSSPEDAAVSQAIISLSHSLNLKTIAEGVETPEQQEFLRSRNCDEIQGFHFSRPVPNEEMHRMLLEGGGIAARPSLADREERVLLLLDDEENILEALARLLRPEGYRILRALRPRDALDLLAVHPVGVIVSDLRMPEMNGIDLLRKVRKLHPQTVRILLTAYADKKMLADAINEGAVYKFVPKPWGDEALRQILRDAFQHHEALQRMQRGLA